MIFRLMSGWSMREWRLGACLWFFCVLLMSGSPIWAKSIFVLYDTSGSMEDRRFLPAFGASVLAATLDGRAGRDRLFTMTFADYRAALSRIGAEEDLRLTADNVQRVVGQIGLPAYRPHDMRSLALHQGVVADLNQRFSTTRAGTPYGAVEIMLDAINRETVAGEETHLIIVSDGEFQANPDSNGVLASIRTHRARIKADLRVSFLLILPSRREDAARAKQLRDNVASQGIRANLLSVFNGDSDRGSYVVNSGPALWAALQDIIVQIAATDRTELGRYVNYQGTEIQIDTPFAITRVVSVATNADGAAPVFQSATFSGNPEVIATNMLGRDNEFPGIGFRSNTAQFRFVPGLPPGRHVLRYDTAVDGNVFLLFDTNVIATLDLFDTATGSAAPRDAQGRPMLEQGQNYVLQTRLSDPVSTLTTDFSRLADSTEFTLELDDGTITTMSRMTRDDAAGLALLPFEAMQAGSYKATAQVRIPGFVSPKSAPLEFIVLDRSLTLSLADEVPTEPCADCAEQELASVVLPDQGDALVASYVVDVQGNLPGRVRLDVPEGDSLIRIFATDGGEIPPGSEVDVIPGQPLAFTVRRVAIDATVLASDPGTDFAIVLTPTRGTEITPLELRRRLRLDVPQATIALRSYDKGRPEDGPMALNDAELLDGATAASLEVQNALLVPDVATVQVTKDGMGWLWSAKLVVDDQTVRVTPESGLAALFWLETGAWVLGRQLDAVVTYADSLGLQRAETRVPITFWVSWRSYFLSLALNLLVLAAAIYAIWVFLALFRVQRFPEHSVVEMRYPMDEMVRRRSLRGSWTIYFGVLLAPFRGAPREVTVVRDLRLISTPGGAQIMLPRHGTPRWFMTNRGQTLREMRELTPSMTSIGLRWGDRLESESDRDESLTFIRDRRKSR